MSQPTISTSIVLSTRLFNELNSLAQQPINKDYLIGITRDLHIKAVPHENFSDTEFYPDALGYVEGFIEAPTDIIYSLAQFLQTEDFYEHDLILEGD